MRSSWYDIVGHVKMFLNVELELAQVAILKCLNLLHDDLGTKCGYLINYWDKRVFKILLQICFLKFLEKWALYNWYCYVRLFLIFLKILLCLLIDFIILVWYFFYTYIVNVFVCTLRSCNHWIDCYLYFKEASLRSRDYFKPGLA